MSKICKSQWFPQAPPMFDFGAFGKRIERSPHRLVARSPADHLGGSPRGPRLGWPHAAVVACEGKTANSLVSLRGA